jgi:transcriptional regulator with GAF, ATPase, and Fis domain
MSVHKLMLKSVACVPIRGPERVLGVLYLEHRLRAGRFRDRDLDLLLAFADQAAIALENARLWRENEQRRRALEARNQELEQANVAVERLLDARSEELEQAQRALRRARSDAARASERYGMVGRSAAMQRVFALIDRVRDSALPVVIQGESGTGKERVARAIHGDGSRRRGAFVAVNCGALPESLIESELFGHVRGAFTGADRDKPGLFVQAQAGSLFLDEFADASARLQIDLLRVLQEGKLRPVGAERDVAVDARVIAAVNRPLAELVRERRLREDLFYRLSVIEIRLPPLRERPEDLPLLCEHLLAQIASQHLGRKLRLSRAAFARIAAHPLPGNVRQLEHMLLSAAMMAEGACIEVCDLPLSEAASARIEGAGQAPLPSALPAAASAWGREAAETDHREPLEEGTAGGSPDDALAAGVGDLRSFKQRERQRILSALERHGWNRAKAATALGMPRRTFYRRLAEFGIL